METIELRSKLEKLERRLDEIIELLDDEELTDEEMKEYEKVTKKLEEANAGKPSRIRETD